MIPRLGILILLAAHCLLGASARSLLKQGNQDYDAGEYDSALEAYSEAVEAEPSSPEAYFNRGAALYRQGRFSDAVEAYEQASLRAAQQRNGALEAGSRYNLGNAFVRQGEEQAKSNPRAALDSLQRSLAAYRQALQLNPGLLQAAENIEVAKGRMRALLEQIKNQQQQGGSDSRDSDDLRQQIEQDLEQQQQLSDKRKDLEQQQQQDPQQSQDLAEQQRRLQQDTQGITDQLKSQPQQEQAQERLDKAAQQQQQAAEHLEQQNFEKAEQAQQQAANELQQALEALKGASGPEQPQQAKQQPQSSPQQQPQQDGGQQQAQALQLSPEDILNRERANRKRRDLLLRQTSKKVEKDW